jgi:hypothetical protein
LLVEQVWDQHHTHVVVAVELAVLALLDQVTLLEMVDQDYVMLLVELLLFMQAAAVGL